MDEEKLEDGVTEEDVDEEEQFEGEYGNDENEEEEGEGNNIDDGEDVEGKQKTHRLPELLSSSELESVSEGMVAIDSNETQRETQVQAAELVFQKKSPVRA